MDDQNSTFRSWAILEGMGHRRLAGFVSERVIAGAAFIQIDIPGRDGRMATQFYSPQSVYALTPTTEEVARAMAMQNQPEPVHPWELPAPQRDPDFQVQKTEDDSPF